MSRDRPRLTCLGGLLGAEMHQHAPDDSDRWHSALTRWTCARLAELGQYVERY